MYKHVDSKPNERWDIHGDRGMHFERKNAQERKKGT